MAIYLHIGFPKTATTSLQLAFRDHQSELAEAGLCYPLIDADFKQRYLKLFDQKSASNDPKLQDKLRADMATMAEAIAASGCPDTILSCEELTNFMMMAYAPDNLRRLRDALFEIDLDVRIVAYVRNPSDFYLSILQERLKRHGGVLAPDTFRTNFARTIRLYEEVFETDAIVREFHPSRLKDKDIVADFLAAAGLTRVDHSAWEAVSSNESISPEVMTILDQARRETVEGKTALNYRMPDSEFLWRRMRRVAADLDLSRKPLLYKAAHDQVMAGNVEDCETLNARYGIDFAQGKFTDASPRVPCDERISDLEGLMDVDRTQSTYIWSVFTAEVIREVLRQRRKIETLRTADD